MHLTSRRRLAALLTLAVLAIALSLAFTSRPQTSPPSAWWLGALPDGPDKRRFLLDCTGCHQFDARIATVDDRPRTEAEWAERVTRMLSFAGATTGFPVIAHDRAAAPTAAWLARSLAAARIDRPALAGATRGTASIVEYPLPHPEDLPHDVAVDAAGHGVVTGMFSNALYVIDPATARLETVPIPGGNAGARAVEIDSTGAWWVLLGGQRALGRYDPRTARWQTTAIGMYAHSIGLDPRGRVWFNGHFTRDPEQIGRLEDGAVRLVDLPRHPTQAAVPGGPIPYELRVAPDGAVWISELQGNRLVRHDPVTGASEAFDMPEQLAGPRRFDIDRQGVLWIPAYAAGTLVRFDPVARRFDTYPLPIRDALPYVVRVDHGTGSIWLGTGAADAVLRFDPAARRFTVYDLPSRGALVRHLAVDPRTHDVWIAYGASPGRLSARVARLTPRD